MPKWSMSLRSALLFFGLFLPVLLIHYGLDRSSGWLLPAYAFAFLFYWMTYRWVTMSFNQLLFIAVLIRLAMFFGPPSLSDDYFRFVWDGRLVTMGINPYQSTPSALIDQLPEDFDQLYQALNSPSYHTTYPPLSQYIFSASSWLGIKDVFLALNVIRGLLFLFEIGCLWLIFQLTSRVSRVMIYAFNPLVILELVGNLHFEGVVLFFLLLAIWLYQKNRWYQAALSISLGILAKLTPLMLLPLLVKKIGLKRAGLSYLVIAIVVILFSLPLLDFEIIKGMLTGLDLFFRKFEFNAGIFFLFREIGFQVKGYDIVQTLGPWLSYTAMGLIIIYSFFVITKDTNWSLAFTVVMFIQLLLATTVHPWYVIPLVALSCVSGFAFPVIWSLMVFFSYFGYSPGGYGHPMILIALEYIVVISVGVYEILNKKPLLNEV